MSVPIEAEFYALMHETFRMQLLADPCPVQEFDGSLFQNAGPNAP
jgi:hypothetical protein